MAVGRMSFPQRKTVRDFQNPSENHWHQQVVEHEMDMDRMDRRPSMVGWVIELARRLMGLDYKVVKPPRRAVAREYEEAWPSRE